MKIVVLGSDGMAGHLCFDYFKTKSYQVFGTSRKNNQKNKITIDVFDVEGFEKKINKINPDVIINCIGVLVNESISNPKNAIFINSFFPHFLDTYCKKNNVYLIHLSTDCVFSGSNGPYKKDSYKDEENYYGLSKSLGEIKNDNAFTIRTSIIGPEIKINGTGLFHWINKKKDEAHGYTNVYWSGVTTLFLAKYIDSVLKIKPKGLIQLSNNISISKYDLLVLIKKYWNLDLKIKKSNTKKINKTLINSDLNIGLKVPNYNIMLNNLKQYMSTNKSLYTNYL